MNKNNIKQVRTIRARFIGPTDNNYENRVSLKDLKFGTRKTINCDGSTTTEASINYLKSLNFDVLSISVDETKQEYLIQISWYPLDLPQWENKHINGKKF